jgi:hypothetical protein
MACGNQIAGPEEAAPAMIGVIAGMIEGSRDPRLLIKDLEDPDGASMAEDSMLVNIRDRTELRLTRHDGSISPATVHDLAVGLTIRVSYSGVIMRSRPSQVEAIGIDIRQHSRRHQ